MADGAKRGRSRDLTVILVMVGAVIGIFVLGGLVGVRMLSHRWRPENVKVHTTLSRLNEWPASISIVDSTTGVDEPGGGDVAGNQVFCVALTANPQAGEVSDLSSLVAAELGRRGIPMQKPGADDLETDPRLLWIGVDPAGNDSYAVRGIGPDERLADCPNRYLSGAVVQLARRSHQLRRRSRSVSGLDLRRVPELASIGGRRIRHSSASSSDVCFGRCCSSDETRRLCGGTRSAIRPRPGAGLPRSWRQH